MAWDHLYFKQQDLPSSCCGDGIPSQIHRPVAAKSIKTSRRTDESIQKDGVRGGRW